MKDCDILLLEVVSNSLYLFPMEILWHKQKNVIPRKHPAKTISDPKHRLQGISVYIRYCESFINTMHQASSEVIKK